MSVRYLPRDVLVVVLVHLLLLLVAGFGGRLRHAPPASERRMVGGYGRVMRVAAVGWNGSGASGRKAAKADVNMVAKVSSAGSAVVRSAGRSGKLRDIAVTGNNGSKPEIAKSQSNQNQQTSEVVRAKSSVLNAHLDRYRDQGGGKDKKRVARNNPTKSRSSTAVADIGGKHANSLAASSTQLVKKGATNASVGVVGHGDSRKVAIDSTSYGVSRNGGGWVTAGDDGGFFWNDVEGGEGLVSVVGEYQQEIMQAVSYYWDRPEGLNANEYCCYLVELSSQGYITGLKLERSSGNYQLNSSAKAAIYAADPLPIPDENDLYQQFKRLRLIFRGNGTLGGSN